MSKILAWESESGLDVAVPAALLAGHGGVVPSSGIEVVIAVTEHGLGAMDQFEIALRREHRKEIFR